MYRYAYQDILHSLVSNKYIFYIHSQIKGRNIPFIQWKKNMFWKWRTQTIDGAAPLSVLQTPVLADYHELAQPPVHIDSKKICCLQGKNRYHIAYCCK